MTGDLKTKDFHLEVKALTDEGTFEGYGSVFNNVDSYGERVAAGAFAKSLAKHAKDGTSPLMLWQHDPWSPIGVWEDLAENNRGLKGKGRLVLETVKGRETYALLKAGAIRGLSIGYRVIDSEPEEGKGTWLLKELDLMEISVVSFPANGKATVTATKSQIAIEDFARRLRDGEPPDVKDFEGLLRDAGIPKAMAVRIASVGYAKAIRSESEGEASKATVETISALSAAIAGFKTLK